MLSQTNAPCCRRSAQPLSKAMTTDQTPQQTFDRQPLATIPYISTVAEVRGRIRRTVAAVLAAAAAPAALIAVHQFYMPLPIAFQNLYQWLTTLA